MPRVLYLSRHGESEYNVLGLLGGDPDLSDRGKMYAVALKEWMKTNGPTELTVWTSSLKRTIQTASGFARCGVTIQQWQELDELNAGVCDGLSYQRVEEIMPEEFSMRDADKYGYRYPEGESYADVVARLSSALAALKRSSNVLVICHQAVARCLLGSFLGTDPQDLPYTKVPLHTIIKLTFSDDDNDICCGVEHILLAVAAVDTHRPKNTKCMK